MFEFKQFALIENNMNKNNNLTVSNNFIKFFNVQNKISIAMNKNFNKFDCKVFRVQTTLLFNYNQILKI